MQYSFADSQLSVLDFAQYIQKEGYADTIEDLRRIREDVKKEVSSVSYGMNEGFNIKSLGTEPDD